MSVFAGLGVNPETVQLAGTSQNSDDLSDAVRPVGISQNSSEARRPITAVQSASLTRSKCLELPRIPQSRTAAFLTRSNVVYLRGWTASGSRVAPTSRRAPETVCREVQR